VEIGSLIFLVKSTHIEKQELIVLVENYNENDNTITSSKVILLKKGVTDNDIELIPLNNMFLISSIADDENNMSGYITFNLNNFDAYGLVHNNAIIELFNKNFGIDVGTITITQKPNRKKKNPIV
jgi:hypothetical protein